MIFIFQYILALILIPFEVCRKRERVVDILTIFNAVYFICFVIAPISAYYMLIDMRENYEYYSVLTYVTSGRYDFTSYNFYFTGILSVLLFIILSITYLAVKIKFKITFFENIFTRRISYKRVYCFALVLLGLSGLALGYSVLSTGFTEWFFSNPRMYFQGSVDNEELSSDSWIVDKTFMLSQVSALLFWGLYQKQFDNQLIQENKPLKLLLPLFLISFGLAAMFLFRSSGRLTFFRFIAIFLIGGMYVSPKHLFKKATIIFIFGIFVVLYGRSLFRIFLYTEHVISSFSDRGTELKGAFFSFVNNFTFPFFAASHNLNYIGKEINYFLDLIKSPFAIIPSRFIEVDLSSTSDINTLRAIGQPDSTIPPDILSYGLINGSLLGIVLVGVSFGVILKLMNSYAGRLANPMSAAIFIYLAFNLGFRVMYFDPIHFLRGTFPFIIAMIFYSLLVYRLKSK